MTTTTVNATSAGTRTRAFLACAAAATPVWAVVSFAQAFTREGFDITRHPLSALANGALGWIQIANFLIVGALVIAGGIGLRRALRGAPGGTWAPRLVVVNGIAMIAAGVFVMDPADGFPVGTPAGMPEVMSWHSVLHMLSGSVAFAALSAACFILGRHFSRRGDRATAVAARVAGAAVIAGNAWAMPGGAGGSLTPGARRHGRDGLGLLGRRPPASYRVTPIQTVPNVRAAPGPGGISKDFQKLLKVQSQADSVAAWRGPSSTTTPTRSACSSRTRACR